jgi:hypothetical protein
MAIRKRPEQELQKQIARVLDTVLKPEVVWFHVPNGGKRSAVEGAIFKAMGVKPGIPDIIITWLGPDGPLVLAIELKAGKGKPSDNQVIMMDRLSQCGWIVREARSVVDVLELARQFMVPMRLQES